MRNQFNICALVLGLGLSSASAQMHIQFNSAPGMDPLAIQGFQDAAALWEAVLFDNIEVNIDIDFRNLSGPLGQASSTQQLNTYDTVRNALIGDAQGGDDTAAAALLSTASALDVYINGTSDNPNGSGSTTPYVDNDGGANNTTIRLNTANAKALGLRGAFNAATDATIEFSDQFSWDFNPSDGITPGAFDFVGVAAHEIGHALGFVSGVDVLDFDANFTFPFPDNAYTFISPLDLFRYSVDSVNAGADLDWTADTRAKHFSIDGGATALATYSTGSDQGDGRQASHWKDNLGIGIMDPTAAPGEALSISALDIQAFDLMGFNLTQATGGSGTGSNSIPEPQTAMLWLVGLVVLKLARSAQREVATASMVPVQVPVSGPEQGARETRRRRRSRRMLF